MKKARFLDRLLYNAADISFGGPHITRAATIDCELINIRLASGRTREAMKLAGKHLMSIISTSDTNTSALLNRIAASGFDFSRMFSFRRMISNSFSDPESVLESVLLNLLRTDKDMTGRILKKLSFMPFPKGHIRQLKRIIEAMQELPAGMNMEDSWVAGKEVADWAALSAFLNDMMTIVSASRISHIKSRAETMIQTLPEDSMTMLFMKQIVAYALLREGKIDEAEKLLLSISAISSSKEFNILKFEIAFARNDMRECRRQLDNFRLLSPSASGKQKAMLRFREICMDAAIREKEQTGISREEMQGYIDECIALASDNAADSSAYLKTLAYFLYIRKCHDSAASAFMAAAETENNMTDKAYFLEIAAQAEKYDMDENGPGMVSLFEDWLGNPAFGQENVIRCIKTMLPIKKTWKNPEKETIFRYIGHAAQHAENPHEYISRIADAVAAMEFDEDNESALYGITDILCRLHGRFGRQEGKASNMSGLLTLLSRTSEIAANSPEWMRPDELSKIYDMYRIIGTNSPPDIIKARLRKSADQPSRLDNSFPDILEHELENGYEPDMEACVLAIGFYMSRGMETEAEKYLDLLETKVEDKDKYAMAIAMCRALADAVRGEYAAAADKFSSILTQDFEHSAGNIAFQNLFSMFPNLTSSNDNMQTAAIACILAGKYREDLEYAGRIKSEKDKDYTFTSGLLVYLSLIHPGLQEDADKFFNEKFGCPFDENFNLMPGQDTMALFFVCTETTKIFIRKGETAKASRMLLKAKNMYYEMPAICRTEFKATKALLPSPS